jgi:hypothetical protein
MRRNRNVGTAAPGCSAAQLYRAAPDDEPALSLPKGAMQLAITSSLPTEVRPGRARLQVKIIHFTKAMCYHAAGGILDAPKAAKAEIIKQAAGEALYDCLR